MSFSTSRDGDVNAVQEIAIDSSAGLSCTPEVAVLKTERSRASHIHKLFKGNNENNIYAS